MDEYAIEGAAEYVEKCAPAKPTKPPRPLIKGGVYAFVTLGVLVVLADWLLWGHRAGVSYAVFFLLLAVTMMAGARGTLRPKEWCILLTGTVVFCLPLMVFVGVLSLLFPILWLFALMAWLVCNRVPDGRDILAVFGRYLGASITELPRSTGVQVEQSTRQLNFYRILQIWLVPIALGAVFLYLFLVANPVLEALVAGISLPRVEGSIDVWRLVFWAAIAALVWPLLHLGWQGLRPRYRANRPAEPTPFQERRFFSAQTVRISLTLFNFMFAMQSVLDIGILTGGFELPHGMSYAEYAHRGAYPLIVTALLAGAFVAIAQPFIRADVSLKPLIYLWVGQNLLLVVTAAIRLAEYIDVYSLTHLRLATLIWMGVVFMGLGLTILQTLRNLPFAWLARYNMLTLGAVLYACCFVNFPLIIAQHNFNNQTELVGLDERYLCNLGPKALPALMEAEPPIAWIRGTNEEFIYVGCSHYEYRPPVKVPRITKWQEWGLHRWQLEGYLTEKW